LSSVSVPKTINVDEKSEHKDDNNDDDYDDDDDDNDAPGTPSRSTEVTGSVMTPLGRRSARLRAKND
jgi:hypothetical protein